jgi:hypothetical protein
MAFGKQSAGGGEMGLAILRIGTGATLFLRHGWEKQPMHWAQFMAHFPDPIHIGAHASFFIAFLSDFVCALLLVAVSGRAGWHSSASATSWWRGG